MVAITQKTRKKIAMSEDVQLEALLSSFKAGNEINVQILRNLVSFNDWVVPAEEDENGRLTPSVYVAGDKVWLRAFTSAANFAVYLKGNDDGKDSLTITMSGMALFRSLVDGLGGLDINPYHETSIHFKPEQFENARNWSTIVEIERTLQQSQHSPAQYAMLRDFDGYYVVMGENEQGQQKMLIAPYTKGRNLRISQRKC